MRNFFLCISFLALFARFGNADCGGETWITSPKDIDPSILSETTAVTTLSASTVTFTQLNVYEFKGDKFTAVAKVPTTKVIGISHSPTCRPPKNALDGIRIPVFEIKGPYVRVALNAKYKSSIWIRPDEFGSQDIILISSLPKHLYVRTDLLPTTEGLPVYQKPAVDEPHTMLPKSYSLLSVLQQSGDFIQIGLSSGEGEVKPIGWIRIRDDSGRLTVWPWYYDDC